MDDVSLEARVEAAFTPSERDMARLAALDIREGFTDADRKLLGGTTDLP